MENQIKTTARMVVVYKTPENIAAFDDHYFNVHVPLAKQLPGLEAYEINAGPIMLLGSASDTYRVAILYFKDMETLKNSFASPIGISCAQDRKQFASDEKVQTFIFEAKHV